MKTIKGFVTMKSLIDNTSNAISPIGELSLLSLTYSKDIELYSIDSLPGMVLNIFSSKDENLNRVPVSEEAYTATLKLVSYLTQYFTDTKLPIDDVDLNDYLYNADPNVYSFGYGSIVQANTQKLPEWINFKLKTIPDLQFRIWFSDSAFIDQYDEYEITVIPPFQDLDYFYQASPTLICERLAAITTSDVVAAIETYKGNKPFTVVRNVTANYISQTTPSTSCKSDWNVLIYGAAGDSIDSIKDAIVEYILSHSKFDRESWTKILPDIFRRVEFVYLPRWDKIAVENMVTITGIYSAIVKPDNSITHAINNIPFYSKEHITNSLEIFPHPHKCIQVSVVPGVDNLDKYSKFSLLFPDYLPVPSTSLDFNRMDYTTTQFLDLLEEMIILSETVTIYTVIPRRYRRILRGDKYYLSLLLNNVQHLVSIRNS
jgi:hypothetical protein